MARNERDHLLKEHMRLAKRKIQIDRRLIELEKEMDELLENARKRRPKFAGSRELRRSWGKRREAEAARRWPWNIDMAEILSGTKFKCAFCNGTGIQPRSLRSRCFACRGKGEVEFEKPVMNAQFVKDLAGSRIPQDFLVSVVEAWAWLKKIRRRARVPRQGRVADIIGERLEEITKN